MLRIALLYSLLACSFLAHAEELTYNRVDFQVEAAREVANDLLKADLSADIQDKQPAEIARQLNKVLNDALKKAASFHGVKTSSGNQSTYPVYGKNNQISTWRGKGLIHLESRDFKEAGELIMQLQNELQVGGLQFSVSPDTRRQIENSLITEAIAAFQTRADAIRNAIGAKSYRTVHLSINGTPSNRPIVMMRSAAPDAIPAPEFSGGESRMTVQISGTIELQ